MKQALEIAALVALFFFTSCAMMPERQHKTRTQEIRECVDKFIERFEINEFHALEVCTGIYDRKQHKSKFPYQGEATK